MASLDLFAVFVRVAEAGSFSMAARELGVSKATVSKRVAELEADLGVALLARTTRRTHLTEAGRRVLQRALRIVAEAQAAREEASDARTEPRGLLKVAAPTSFGIGYIGPIVAEFMGLYPEIDIDLSLSDLAVDLIADGYDIAVRIGAMPDSSLVARKLSPARRLLVASPAYLSARGRPTRPEDLSAHACFLYAHQPGAPFWRFAGPDGAKANVRVEPRLRYDNGDVIHAAVLAGQGLALQPDFLIWRDVAAGRLEIVLADWVLEPLSLHLLTPPGRVAPRKVRVFSDFVADRFGGARAPWLALDSSSRLKSG